MATSPVPLDRLQACLTAWVSSIGVQAVWAPSGYSGRPGASIRFIGPISGVNAARPVRTLPTAGTFTVPAASPSRIEISGRRWDATGRDAFLALLGAGPTLVNATFAAGGANEITVVGNEVGDLWRPRTSGGATWTATSTAVCEAVIGEVEVNVEVQFFSTDKYLRGGAMATATKLVTHAGSYDQEALFDQYNCSLGRRPLQVTDLTALSGPDFESRAAVTFSVNLLVIDAREIVTIDEVDGTITSDFGTIEVV